MNDKILHNGDMTCDKLFEVVNERIDTFIDGGEFNEAKNIIDKIINSKSCSNYPLYFTDNLKQKLGVIFLNSGSIENAKQVLEELVGSSTRTKNICNFMLTMAAITKDEQLKNIAIDQLKESGENYFMLYSQEILIKLFKRISKYPPIFGEDTVWGKVKGILRNSLSLPNLFKTYIPILLDVFEFLYDSITFESKDMFIVLIVEEIKHANKTMKINDSIVFKIMKERFGLNVIKYNYFIKS